VRSVIGPADGYLGAMGAGMTLLVIGAILAFAVTDKVPNINLPVVGLILMVAGGILIANAQRGARRERRVLRREESEDPDGPTRIVEEVEQERGDDRHSR
jgi:membrane protein implicated in regulation of membrane protease activity